MGNVTAAEALTLCRDLAIIINTPAAPAGQQAAGTAVDDHVDGSSSRLVLDVAERPVEVCVQLPEGVEVLRVEPTRNPEEDNCCVEVYYQVRSYKLISAAMGEHVQFVFHHFSSKSVLAYKCMRC